MVEPGFLHQVFLILGIDHPHQVISHLKLQIVIAADVAEELGELDLLQVDVQHIRERRNRLVRHNIYAAGLA